MQVLFSGWKNFFLVWKHICVVGNFLVISVLREIYFLARSGECKSSSLHRAKKDTDLVPLLNNRKTIDALAVTDSTLLGFTGIPCLVKLGRRTNPALQSMPRLFEDLGRLPSILLTPWASKVTYFWKILSSQVVSLPCAFNLVFLILAVKTNWTLRQRREATSSFGCVKASLAASLQESKS